MNDDYEDYTEPPYKPLRKINFSIITSKFRQLPFFEDDLFLGMQAINIGITDTIITQSEYDLKKCLFNDERTLTQQASVVSALSQLWVFGLYEVMRLWRDRKFEFEKLYNNGGIESKIDFLESSDPLNITVENRKKQLSRYKSDKEYRDRIIATWAKIENVYRMIEIFRMNFAKHSAPGKDNQIPRAPGYGRINSHCGSMDYELIERDGTYSTMNRRDIADYLRNCIESNHSL